MRRYRYPNSDNLRVLRRLHVAIVLLALGALSAISVSSVPAARAQGPGGESGESVFAPLIEAGMVALVDQRQTIDGVTVTLNWLYADTNTLAVQYQVAGLPPFTEEQAVMQYAPYSQLTDADGNAFLISGGGVSWVESDSNADSTTLHVDEQYNPQAVYFDAESETYQVMDDYFNTLYGDDLPEQLPLTLTIVADDDPAMDPPPMSTGGIPPEGIGPFTFDVVVPLHPESQFEVNDTVTANDLDVTLETLTLTPARVRARICYDLPDSGDWHPVAALTVDGNAALRSGYGIAGGLPDPSDVRRCEEHRFAVATPGDARTLTLTVEALRTSIPETREYWESVRDALAEHGIVIEVVMGRGRYFDFVSKPDGMTDMQVGETLVAVQESLLPAVDGPWVFEVALDE